MIREADKDGMSPRSIYMGNLDTRTGDGMIDYNEFVTMMMAKVSTTGGWEGVLMDPVNGDGDQGEGIGR
jgi:hypothetical protein